MATNHRRATPEFMQLKLQLTRLGRRLHEARQAPAGPPPAALPAKPTLALPRFKTTLQAPAGARPQPEVANLQKVLAACGYDAPVTSIFDAATRQALIAFQQARGVPANGVVGSETRRLLNEMVTG